ncbi:MAG: biotin--[acetyl-CoA-carboxylase] ligase [Saprospiraceae bacterium]|nr:biotin--[acetyl-CoA-carboxylase] ligase [Saprospiraceae bacterium]
MSNTLFVGKVYHRFDELPSTNDWAAQIIASVPSSPATMEGTKEAAKTKPPEGTVVRAANQTAGRGQLGSQWHSSAGENLLMSVIFYPTWLEVQAQFYLSMAVALGVHDVIGSFLSAVAFPPAEPRRAGAEEERHSSLGNSSLGHSSLGHSSLSHSIKWPNDLYLGDKKTAGILIQNALSGSNLQSAIVGIGLNVNQLEFPADLPNATSMARTLGHKFDLEEVADRLFEGLERRYLQLKAGHRSAIKAEYEEHLWRRGENSRFVRSADGSAFEGVILGVTEQGLLRVETSKSVEGFEVKELVFVV